MIARRAALAGFVLLPAMAAGQAPEVVRGPVRPRQLAQLAPQIDGVVKAVDVTEGARVAQGAVLIRLVDDVQAARIGLARAAAEADGEVRAAQVQLAEASAVLARVQSAQAARAAGEWEVRQSRARLESARAALDVAEERRRVERQRLELELATADLHLVRAPFDGIVTRLDTVPGATVTRSDRLVVVADLAVLEAVLYLPAAAWALLRAGASCPLRLSAPADRTVVARLRFADPVMDAASGRFRTIFTIDNADGALPAGLEAELDLAGIGAE